MDFVGFLPKEITNFIFESLPVADLLSCGLCSKTWRQAGNLDELWFKFCIEKGWADGKDKTSCQTLRNALYVEVPASKSHLQVPSGISLDPLCDWRIYYTECVMMRKRWRSGTCVRKLGRIPHSDTSYPIYFTTCTAFDGELLAVGDSGGRVILWNITGDPVHIVQTYESRQNDAALTDVHLHQKHLLICRGKLLRVHRISDLQNKSTVAYELDMESYLEYTGPGTYDTMKNRMKDLTGFWITLYQHCLVFQDGMMALSGSLISQVRIFCVATGELIQSIALPGSFFCISKLLFIQEDLYIPSYSVLGAEGQGCVFVRNIKECSWKKEAECSEVPYDISINEHILALRTVNTKFYAWTRPDGIKVPLGNIALGSNLIQFGKKLVCIRHKGIFILDAMSQDTINLGNGWMFDTYITRLMVKCGENVLVHDVNRRKLQAWDLETGDFLYDLIPFGLGTMSHQFALWSGDSVLVTVPCVSRMKSHTIVCFDFRFSAS